MTHPQTEAKGADAKAAAMDVVGEWSTAVDHMQGAMVSTESAIVSWLLKKGHEPATPGHGVPPMAYLAIADAIKRGEHMMVRP